MKCFVGCGKCCDLWRDVIIGYAAWERKAAKQRGIERREVKDLSECPFLGEEGCLLPRKNRPRGCLGYFCSLSIAYGVLGVLTEGEAMLLASRFQHNSKRVCKLVNGNRRRLTDDGMELKRGEKKVKVQPVRWELFDPRKEAIG